MGWNAGYTIFEATVIGAYDLDKLDKPLLRVLMLPYKDTDIDAGGSCDLKTKDGLDVEDVVLKVMGVKRKPFPKGKRGEVDQAAVDAWYEWRYEAFHKVTRKMGW